MRRAKVYWRWLRMRTISQGWEATDTGWLLTTLIVALVQWAAFRPANNSKYANKFEEFVHLKPSEMGDTLAGVFAALAFVWIIVTVFLQSKELREQRKEFREQRIATQDMARAMAAQAAVFEDEQRQRSETAAKEHIEELLDEVLSICLDELDGLSWRTLAPEDIHEMYQDSWGPRIRIVVFEGQSKDRQLSNILTEIVDQYYKIQKQLLSETVLSRPSRPSSVVKLSSNIRKVAVLSQDVSQAQLARLSKLGIFRVQAKIEAFAHDCDLWVEEQREVE